MARPRPLLPALAAASLAALAAGGALAASQTPAAPGGPPFDLTLPTPHAVSMTVDTGPARDFLVLVGAGETAPAALRRLKASRPVLLALEAEERSVEPFFGRLVTFAAGTPDPFLSGIKSQAGALGTLLEAMETDGTAAAIVEGRRIASLLPSSPPVRSRLTIVPFFGIGGFTEVRAVEEGDQIYLVCDLARILSDSRNSTPPRESVLKVLRAASSEAWRRLFTAGFRKSPAWPASREATFDELLARTVSEGAASLFLFPDEFFPLSGLLEEPISRAFDRWNEVAELLLSPKLKDEDRRRLLDSASGADFWGRFDAVVGAQMTETILQRSGQAAYVKALAGGPRAVVALYAGIAKEAKTPQLGKAAKKALEPPPSS